MFTSTSTCNVVVCDLRMIVSSKFFVNKSTIIIIVYVIILNHAVDERYILWIYTHISKPVIYKYRYTFVSTPENKLKALIDFDRIVELVAVALGARTMNIMNKSLNYAESQ